MKNREVATILYEIADLLEMKGVEWRPRSYRKAARSVESLSEPIEELYEEGRITEVDGIGESIGSKIEEFLETGSIEYHQELKEEVPVDIEALTSVESLGPKKVMKLYEALEIKDLEDLEKACEEGEVAEVEGFGEKSQEKILSHIEFARKGQDRMLLGKAFPEAQELKDRLQSSDNFDNVAIVGSFRRRRPTVGDIDILATSSSVESAMSEFCNMIDVKEVRSKGETMSSVVVSGDLQVDLRIVEEGSIGAAKQYFTGSKDHNITLRKRAIQDGLKLNEYGLFRNDDKIVGEEEREIYRRLGLQFIPPELREDTGEVEAASRGNLPQLVEYGEMNGDFQMHTDYSDGDATIQEMAEKADSLGYDYILVTDHGPSLHVAGGPQNREELLEQQEEIEEANQDYSVEVLHGVEANITKNGLDLDKDALEVLDLVAVALHNKVENATERIIQVFEDYQVDIFVHPTNRKINQREEMDLDMDRIIEKAEEENVAIEINSQPKRLDLPWEQVKKYRDQVDFVVSTDAHRPSELELIHLGVAQARRGWLTSEDVVNTKTLEELKSYFDL